MSIEAMKQALEALLIWEKMQPNTSALAVRSPAITSLRQAIEQAEKQEPVAWRYRGNLHEFDPSDWSEGPVTPLYTTPPQAQRQWVGFTDEEINEYDYDYRDFIYDIEALLKHKNTRLG
jgi:hypothetical protein